MEDQVLDDDGGNFCASFDKTCIVKILVLKSGFHALRSKHTTYDPGAVKIC